MTLDEEHTQFSDETGPKFRDEEEKLSGHHPFPTILKMTIGPMLFSAALALQDSIDLFFVRKGYGSEGVTIISILSSLKMLVLSISTVFQQAAIIKFSEFVTKGRNLEVNSLYADLFRILVGFGILVAFILPFGIKPLMGEMGMPEEYRTTALIYMLPVCISLPINIGFQIGLSALMGLGKANQVAVIELSALAFSIAADPLFIYVFKAPLWSLSIAYISGNTIAGICITIYFLCGKEKIAPKLSDFKARIHPELWQTLKLSIPGILQITTNMVGPIVLMTIIAKAAKKIGQESVVSTVFSTSTKPYSMIVAIVIGGMVGLVPAATYAFEKNDLRRIIGLTLSALFLPYIIIISLWPILVFKPELIMKIWITDEHSLAWIPKITPKICYTLVLEPISTILGSIIVVFRRPILATSAFVVKFIVFLSSVYIYADIFTKNPEKILFCYPTADVVNCLYTTSLLLYSFFKIKKDEDTNIITNSLLSNDDSLSA